MKTQYPTLLVILDGVGDESIPELGNRTPLQAAHLPTLDRLAQEGQCGLADPVSNGVAASTAEGTLAILGYDAERYPLKRGAIEAFGANLPIQSGDIALRGNFACIEKNGRVKNRRAGRIREGTEELTHALNQMAASLDSEVEFTVGAGTEHRFALVMKGAGLSAKIVGSDPKDTNPHGLRITPHAIDPDDLAAQRTAIFLDQFEQAAQSVLERHPVNEARLKQGLMPANAVLTRDPGAFVRLPAFQIRDNPLKGLCIARGKTVLGLAEMIGMDTYSSPSMTANLDTDLEAKFSYAVQKLTDYDLVLVHIKGTDIAAHDLLPQVKTEFLEKIDQELGRALENFKAPLRVAVIADHCTSSLRGCHIEGPVPLLICSPGLTPDSVQKYDETQATEGYFGRFSTHQFLPKLLHEFF